MRRALFALPFALAAMACSTGPGSVEGVTAVHVSTTYRERLILPPDHVLTVRIEDVSLADAPAAVLAEESQSVAGRSPPYGVSLDVRNSRIDPSRSYAVRTEIRDPAGNLRFTTDTRYPVLTQGAPNRADIVMVGVR